MTTETTKVDTTFVEPNIDFSSVNIVPIEQVESESQEQPDETEVEGPEQQVQPSVENIEGDLMLLSSGIWSMPGMIFNRLTPLSEEQVKGWNRQLYLYCQKKGIDPFTYLFDELGLLLSTVTLGAGIFRDYQDKYPKNQKRELTSKERMKEGVEDAIHLEEVEVENVGKQHDNDN